MGGWGSGRRWSSKATTDDHKRLDVLWMKRNGCLKAGNSGSIKWSCNGEPAGNIDYRACANSVQLIYKVRRPSEEWQSIDMPVQLSWSDCRFGGQRPYFICPVVRCGKRVQHLYDGFPYFVCRHCLNLAYGCQREELLDRAARRADKLREKLGVEGGVLNGAPFRKPKGMHRKTYYRLCAEEMHFRQTSLQEMCNKFGLRRDEYMY